MISSIISWVRLTPFRIELSKLLTQHGTESGNWIKKDTSLSLYRMGERCEKDFSKYLHGKSTIQLETPRQIQEWLLTCRYVARTNSEGLSDKWLHPIEFEHLKQGHCVDFSLFCWRKLCETGYKSELVLGTRFREGENRQHAWVTFISNGSEYIFEPLPIQGRDTIEPLQDIVHIYTPWNSISCKLQSYIYTGYLSALNLR